MDPATRTMPVTMAPKAATPTKTEVDTKNAINSPKPQTKTKMPSFKRLISSINGARRRTSRAKLGSS